MAEEQQKSGWWGTALSKLKTALHRTKSALVDPLVEASASEGTAEEAESGILIEDAGGSGADGAQLADTAVSGTSWAQSADTTVSSTGGAQPTGAAVSSTGGAQPTGAAVSSTGEAQPAGAAVSSTGGARPAGATASTTGGPQLAGAAEARAATPSVVARRPAPPPRPARAVDEIYLSEVEEKLIRADVGIATAETLVDHMRREALSKMWNSNDVEVFLKREFHAMLKVTASNKLNVNDNQLAVILVVGVNGTGKTTSIGKLCWRLRQQGKKVLIAAGDTFRAAAETQLEIWAERAGVDIVRLPDGSDPGAVVYKAIEKAKAESFDVLVIDTAGRLHNKANLMAELKKIRAVVDKNAAGCSIESLLVVDASVGQNGLQQAKLFAETCPLTGVILAKLDGSAKGGIVFSIARDLNLPIKLVGLGEKIDDLRDFEPPVFVEALFAR